jgi:hypothetical protein
MTGRDHYKGHPVYTATSDVNINSVKDGPHVDGFSRLNVTEPLTLFDCVMNRHDHPLLWSSYAVQDSTAIYQLDRASVFLSVGTASGDRIYRRTKRYMHYQPGKSMKIMVTGIFSALKTGLTQRIGYFDASDGLFFETRDTVLGVVIRSSVSGSTVDIFYPQSDWSMDKLDGKGASSIGLDLSKIQTFIIDFGWMGAGRVRFGFRVGGQTFYCHEVNHGNVLDSVYMQNPSLPVTYEILNTSTTSEPSTLEQVCATVIAEGGYNPKGIMRSLDMGDTSKVVSSGDRYALLTVRLTEDNFKSYLEPTAYEVLSISKDDVHVELILNGILDGTPSWYTPDSVGGMEQDVSATTVSGGVHLWSAYTNELSAGRLVDPQFNESFIRLCSTASGVADTLTLSVTVVGPGSATVIGNINIKEIV